MQELERTKVMAEKMLKDIREAKESVAVLTERLALYQSIGTPQECMEAIYLAQKIGRMADTFRRVGFQAFEHPQSATEMAMQTMARQMGEKQAKEDAEKLKRLAKFESTRTFEEFMALKGE